MRVRQHTDHAKEAVQKLSQSCTLRSRLNPNGSYTLTLTIVGRCQLLLDLQLSPTECCTLAASIRTIPIPSLWLLFLLFPLIITFAVFLGSAHVCAILFNNKASSSLTIYFVFHLFSATQGKIIKQLRDLNLSS